MQWCLPCVRHDERKRVHKRSTECLAQDACLIQLRSQACFKCDASTEELGFFTVSTRKLRLDETAWGKPVDLSSSFAISALQSNAELSIKRETTNAPEQSETFEKGIEKGIRTNKGIETYKILFAVLPAW
jgi:hypothetical protein